MKPYETLRFLNTLQMNALFCAGEFAGVANSEIQQSISMV